YMITNAPKLRQSQSCKPIDTSTADRGTHRAFRSRIVVSIFAAARPARGQRSVPRLISNPSDFL
ncbi:hypothetical protein, partial [Bradyrhizobium sp. 38]